MKQDVHGSGNSVKVLQGAGKQHERTEKKVSTVHAETQTPGRRERIKWHASNSFIVWKHQAQMFPFGIDDFLPTRHLKHMQRKRKLRKIQ